MNVGASAIEALGIEVVAGPRSPASRLGRFDQLPCPAAGVLIPLLSYDQIVELTGHEGTHRGPTLGRHDPGTPDHILVELKGQVSLGHP